MYIMYIYIHKCIHTYTTYTHTDVPNINALNIEHSAEDTDNYFHINIYIYIYIYIYILFIMI